MNLFKWFKKTPKTSCTQLANNELASIKFVIGKDHDVDVMCTWASDSTSLGKAYGILLHQINSGQYGESIAQLLSSIMEDESYDREFIVNIYEGWKKAYAEDDQELTSQFPLIHPMQTFGESTL